MEHTLELIHENRDEGGLLSMLDSKDGLLFVMNQDTGDAMADVSSLTDYLKFFQTCMHLNPFSRVPVLIACHTLESEVSDIL